MKYNAHPYQRHSTEHIMRNMAAGLFLEMGLGKTVSALTAAERLLFDELTVHRVLVIAPKKVAEHVWTAEAEKWDHLQHLRLSVVCGTAKQRLAALDRPADIWVINRENVAWLVDLKRYKFDMWIIDELSSFKSAQAQRFKKLRKIRPAVGRVVGLTGTPAPNGLIDLWPQLYLLDRGERLGPTLTEYRERYFTKNPYDIYSKYEIRTEPDDAGYYERKIFDKIGDICISMKAADYLDLPKRIDQVNVVTLSARCMAEYKLLEDELVLRLRNVPEITVANAAVLVGKLLQYANGAVYDSERIWHETHTEKIEALIEDIEAANGQPVFVFYQFRHDLERILNYAKAFSPVVLKSSKDIDAWNTGKVPLMLAHAASAGHGLNLQYGGHLVEWFGVPWGLEPYSQGVTRFDRQGQRYPVINRRLIVKGTMDERVLKVLDSKQSTQNVLIEAIKALVNGND